MSTERIVQLKTSIEADMKKRDMLDERIKGKKAKLDELQNLEIVNAIKAITLDSNTTIAEFITALRKKDAPTISRIMSAQSETVDVPIK